MCSIIRVGERLHKVLGLIDRGTLYSGERLLPFGLLVFGYGVVIYYIMQSSFEKISKTSPCFPSKRGNLQSAILFMLSTASTIITQKETYEISAMSIHSVVKLNFSRLSVYLHNAVPQRR